MEKTKSFRDTISSNKDERVIFGYELLSQPDDSLDSRIPGIRQRNESIITVARPQDIILLSNIVTADYHSWLRSHNFSSNNIYVCDRKPTIPQSVVGDEKLKEWVDGFSGDKVYAARYSSNDEVAAAEYLGARHFGCAEDITLKFYDKVSFKKLCEENGLPVLPSTTVDITEEGITKLKHTIRSYLEREERVMAKDPTSSAGANLYIIDRTNYQVMLKTIEEREHPTILVEKMVSPITEINDQWVIDHNGNILPIGPSDQVIENYAHTGNTFPSLSKQVSLASEYSHKIGQLMRDAGYVGLFGIDYLEDEQRNLYISEDNSRMNGSTPAWDLVSELEARHGNIPAFKLYQIRIGNPMSFTELKDKTNNLLYDGECQFGYIPLDQGLMKEKGAFTILATGRSPKHAENIVSSVLERIEHRG